MDINIIVAITDQRVIGNHGKLPWSIPEDLKLFKDITNNNTVLMGRKTFESIPEKFRPLPNRNNIVITSKNQEPSGVDFCKSIELGIQKAKSYGKPIFIIGGQSIYKEALPLATKLYISHVKYPHEGDIFFPEINFDEWQVIEEKDYGEFIFRKYERKHN